MLAHARPTLAIRFVSLSYHYFLPAFINCLFPWISRALCVPLLPLMSRTRPRPPFSPPLPSPPVPSSHSMTIYPGYVTFVAKNTFRPGRLLMNGREAPFLVPLPRSFFCFRNKLAIDIGRSVWIGHYDIGILGHSVKCNFSGSCYMFLFVSRALKAKTCLLIQ